MNDEQLLRYSRQILLPQLGIEGQQKLLDAHVLIIGMGGLGSPVAMYLAAAGVGTLSIADDDQVELSNLQRQLIHQTESIGHNKVDSAATQLHKLNPDVRVNCYSQRLDHQTLSEILPDIDVVIDATDNFDSRFAINMACVENHKPLISGAAIRMEGQVSIFDMRNNHSPCYRCLYDESGQNNETCSENGVMSPIVGIIGSIQAMEAIKLIAEIGEPLIGKLLITDSLYQEWRCINLNKDPNCPVCSKQ